MKFIFFSLVTFVYFMEESEKVSIGNLISLDSEIDCIEALQKLNSTFVSRVSKFHIVNKSIEHLSHAYEITKNSSNVIKVLQCNCRLQNITKVLRRVDGVGCQIDNKPHHKHCRPCIRSPGPISKLYIR
jgi:hypothetical protein